MFVTERATRIQLIKKQVDRISNDRFLLFPVVPAPLAVNILRALKLCLIDTKSRGEASYLFFFCQRPSDLCVTGIINLWKAFPCVNKIKYATVDSENVVNFSTAKIRASSTHCNISLYLPTVRSKNSRTLSREKLIQLALVLPRIT